MPHQTQVPTNGEAPRDDSPGLGLTVPVDGPDALQQAPFAVLSQALANALLLPGLAYPARMAPEQFAARLVEDLAGDLAPAYDKAWACNLVLLKLANGASQAAVVVEMCRLLSSVPADNPVWVAAAAKYNLDVLTRTVENLAGLYASTEAKAGIVTLLLDRLEAGESLQDLLDWTMTTLNAVSHDHPVWGTAAAVFDNRLAVLEKYALTSPTALTDSSVLLALLEGVTPDQSSVAQAQALLSTAWNGRVIDGYVAGAQVFVDHNGNGQKDPGEPGALTDAQGRYQLPAGSLGRLVATGGVDISTNQPLIGSLTAPAQASIISPLTTLIQSLVDRGFPPALAEAKVLASLGLPAGFDLQHSDPLALALGNGSAAARADAVQVQAALAKVANLLTLGVMALVSLPGGSLQAGTATTLMVEALVLQMLASSAPLDLARASLLEDVFTDALAGQAGSSGPLAADLAQLLAASNVRIDAAVAATPGDAVSQLSQIARIQTVGQGAMPAAVRAALAGGDLDIALADFTGTALDTAIAGVAGNGRLTAEIPVNGSNTLGNDEPPPDESAPLASVEAATVSNADSVVVQSSEPGTVYLVRDSITVSNLASITSAPDNEVNSASIEVANSDTLLAATGLIDGNYHVYTVDAAGNLSAAAAGTVIVDTRYTVSGSTLTLVKAGAIDLSAESGLGAVTTLVYSAAGNSSTVSAAQFKSIEVHTGGAGVDAVVLATTIDDGAGGAWDASGTSFTSIEQLTLAAGSNMLVLDLAAYQAFAAINAPGTDTIVIRGDGVATARDGIENYVLDGLLQFNTIDAADDSIHVALDSGAATINVSAGAASDTVTIDAAALANNVTLTLAAGGGNAGKVNVTGLVGDLDVSNPLSGTISVALADNTVDQGIAIAAGAADLSVSNLADGNTLSVTGFAGATFSGTTAGTTGAFHISTGTANSSIKTGAGNDTIVLAAGTGLTSGDSVDGGSGTDTVQLTGDTAVAASDFDGVSNIEVITLGNTSSAVNITTLDQLVAAGATLTLSNAGNSGALAFNGAAETDGALHITGGTGNDVLTGGAKDDTLIGGDGNDALTAGLGDDVLQGGAGDDSFAFAAGTGLASADTVDGGTGTDTVAVTGNTAVAASDFDGISNIEVITLGNTSTAVTITTLDGLVAAGATLTLSNASNSGALAFNGAAETDGALQITGGTGNDVLTGGANDDTLIGGDGNDGLTAGLGDDVLQGGAGDDSFTFAAGTGLTSGDTVDGGTGTDVVTLTGDTAVSATDFDGVSHIETIILGNTGTAVNITTLDGLVAAGATLTLSNAGNTGVLTFDGSAETDGAFHITGGTGDDNFTFAAGTGLTNGDYVDGGSGTDTVQLTGDTAVAANDFDGVSNIEVITLGNTSTAVNITAQDQLVAAGASLTLTTTTTGVVTFDGVAETDGAFVLVTGAGADVLTGGAGNDQFTSGTGNDTLNGGAGDDSFTFAAGTGLTSGDSVDGGTGTDVVTLTGDTAVAASDFNGVSHIETIILGNTSTAVTITTLDGLVAAGATLTLSNAGNSGVLTFNGAAETDGAFRVTGGTGTDVLTGGAKDDTLIGGDGNDALTAGLGDDVLQGGAGDDNFTFAAGTGLTSADTVDGGSDNDSVTLTGNTIVGATDFSGVSNIETITFGNTTTAVSLVTLDALVTAGATLNLTTTTTGVVTVDAAAETDGHLILNTGAGADVLTGGAGNDQFKSGTGNDKLNGGAGDDTFTFAAGTGLTSGDTIDGGSGSDTVTLTGNTLVAAGDFNGVSNIEAITLGNTNTAVSITAQNALVAAGATLTLSTTTSGAVTFNGAAETDGQFILQSGAGADVLTGGAGNDQFTSGAGNDKLYGGAGDDSFLFAAGTGLTSADIVDGGSGSDTVELGGNTVVAATTFNGVSNIEVIKLGNTNTAVSITTLNTLVAAGATLTLSNASNSGVLTFSGAAETDGAFHITGGSGNDVLAGGAKDDTLIGGDGNDVLTAALGNDTLQGGDGDDTFNFAASTGLNNADLVDGGSGSDTVVLTGNVAITAADTFNGVSNIEAIKLGNTSTAVSITTLDTLVAAGATLTLTTTTSAAVTFNAAAETDGHYSLNTGSGADVLTGGAGNDKFSSNTGNDKLYGGAGDDTFTFAAGTGLSSADSVDGGSGTDTVALTGNTTVASTNFNGVTNVEVIKLGNTNTAVSITTLDGLVAAGATLTLSNASNSGVLTFNGAAETDGTFHITGGSGADVITGGAGNDTFIGNAGNDTFNFVSGTGLTSADSVDGGTGTDTVSLTGNNAVSATDFNGVSNIEAIKLANTNTAVNLTTHDGLVAAGATLTVTTTTSGAVTFDGSAETNGSFTVSTGAGDDLFIAGSGSDNFSGGAGNDRFVFNAGSNLSSADKVNGGTGTDTLELRGNLAINATDLNGISNIDLITYENTDTAVSITTVNTLVASGTTLTVSNAGNSAALTFNGAAEADGAFHITGGSANDVLTGGAGNDTLIGGEGNDALTAGLGNDKLDGGNGDDTLTFVAGTGLTSADTVDGGSGTDTLVLTGNTIVAATSFNGVSNVEVIKLANTNTAVSITTLDGLVAAGTTLTLSNASNSGALTFNGAAETDGAFHITGGSGADVLTGGLGIDTIIGNAGNDSFTFVSGTGLTSADSVDGGSGTDTISLTGNNVVTATDFSGVSNIESIKLANTSTAVDLTTHDGLVSAGATLTVTTTTTGVVTFDGSAEINGSFTVSTGAGDDVFIAGSVNNNFSGNAGNDRFVFNAGSSFTSTDIVNGGTGTDTLELHGNQIIKATDLNGVSNIEVLTLENTDTAVSITTVSALVASGATLTLSNAGNSGVLTFNGAAETDGSFHITGGSNNDVITGGAKDDTLIGGEGNDALTAGLGNDSLQGNNGDDTFNFAAGTGLTSADTVDGGADYDTVVLTGDTIVAATSFNGVSNIEAIKLGNTSTAVSITAHDALVEAGATLTLTTTTTGIVTFNGAAETDGQFILSTGAGSDVLTGGSGNDEFKSSTGSDKVYGGAGDDSFTFAAGTGLTSADVVDGGAGFDTVVLTGNTAVAATDFNGVSSIDVIKLGNTSTTVSITTVNALVGAGTTLTLSNAANSGVLTFNGAAETDGNFSITGGSGADVITGGLGTDTFDGGAGNDTFAFVSGTGLTSADTVDGGTGSDTVSLTGNNVVSATDFNGVSNIEVIKLANTNTAVTITAQDGLVAAGATLTLTTTTSGVLTFDGSADTDSAFAITGGAGNDSITGSVGNDSLSGGLGNDILQGGAGNDTFTFAAGTGLTSADSVDGGSGTDTVTLTGNTTVAATSFDGVSNIEVIKLGNTNTAVNITTQDSLVEAGATLTLTTTTSGVLTFNGAAETDGNFTITGGSGADVITAGAGNDVLAGGSGNDTFNFQAGTGLTGADSVDGGAGTDTLALSGDTDVAADAFDGVSNIEVIKLGNTTTEVSITTQDGLVSAGATLTLSNAANAGSLVFDGSAETNGKFALTGGTGVDTLTGGAGDDGFTFAANTGLTSADTVNGGAGADTVTLTGNVALAAADAFDGVSNIEVITLGNTSTAVNITTQDTLVASGATLTLTTATSGAVTFNGAAETDGQFTLSTGSGSDVLTGGAGNDKFTSSTGNDKVYGGAGDDTFTFAASSGLTSADSVDGGSGSDTVVLTGNSAVAASNFDGVSNIETIKLGNTSSAVAITTKDALVAAGATLRLTTTTTGVLTFNGAQETNGAFSISGGAGNDVVTGGAGNDTLTGNNGNDTLNGGAGNDTLTGGAGADTLNGGTGADIYHYTAPTDGSATAGSGDSIAAANVVSGEDRFQFSETAFGTLGSGTLTAAADTLFDTNQATTMAALVAQADSEYYRAVFTGSVFNQSFYDALDMAFAGGAHSAAAFLLLTNGADSRLLYDADTAAVGGLSEMVRLVGASTLGVAVSDIYLV